MIKHLLSTVFMLLLFVSARSQVVLCNGVTFAYSVSGSTVTFTPTLPPGYQANQYNWNFGNGANSTVSNPVYTYPNPGLYNVCLVVSGVIVGTNNAFQCYVCDSVFISGPASPCNANYTYTTSGNTANFYNTSTGLGTLVSSSWDFGDGNFTSTLSPTHTYTNPGTYNVCVTMQYMNNNIPTSCTYCDSVTVGAPFPILCNASFTSTNLTGGQVSFTNTASASGPITNYLWNFGDGNTSTLANPTHTYNTNGAYTACLTISGGQNTPSGPFTCTYCDSIVVSNANAQNCYVTYSYLMSGNTLSFISTTTGPGTITSYNWDFGNGATSSLPNPTYTYPTSGIYTVCLTVGGVDSNNVAFSCQFCQVITVLGNNVNCNANFTSITSGLSTQFTNTSTAGGTITSYQWNFGDGNTSTLANPTHTYATAGVYQVCLVIAGSNPNNQPFQCSYCDSVVISGANVNCNASFTSQPMGATVNFTNTSTGPGVLQSTAWNFGDGNNSTLANPSHTYANPGWYNVCLVAIYLNNGVAITCVYCDSIYVQVGGGNPCNAVASHTHSILGLNASFTNTSTCAGCLSTVYNWSFGDGNLSTATHPSHTYAGPGTYNVCMIVIGTYNNNGGFCADTICSQINVSGPSNVNDISSSSSLSLYPNPAEDKVTIDLPSPGVYSLKLYDVSGKLIEKSSVSTTTSTHTFSVSQLSRGMYHIRLEQADKIYHTRFVKQ